MVTTRKVGRSGADEARISRTVTINDSDIKRKPEWANRQKRTTCPPRSSCAAPSSPSGDPGGSSVFVFVHAYVWMGVVSEVCVARENMDPINPTNHHQATFSLSPVPACSRSRPWRRSAGSRPSLEGCERSPGRGRRRLFGILNFGNMCVYVCVRILLKVGDASVDMCINTWI